MYKILDSFLILKVKRTLLTTSILEVGIDKANIKYILILEPIFSLISIVQSIGRIRNIGYSYIITREPTKYKIEGFKNNPILSKDKDSLDIKEFRELDKAYYNLFIIEDKCLRLPISNFLDSRLYKCLDTSLKCSICKTKDLELEALKIAENKRYKIVILRLSK